MDKYRLDRHCESAVNNPFFAYKGQDLRQFTLSNAILWDVSDRRGLKQAVEAAELEPSDKEALESDLVKEGADLLGVLCTHIPTFSQEWDQVDQDTQDEIIQTWKAMADHANGCQGDRATTNALYRGQLHRELHEARDAFFDKPTQYYSDEAWKYFGEGVRATLGVIEGTVGGGMGYHLQPKNAPLGMHIDLSLNLSRLFDNINS